MPNYTQKPKTDQEVLADEDKAWHLRTRGWTQQRIGDELGVCQQTVSVMLKRASAKFHERFMQDMKVVKDEQVAQLSLVADEALQGWFKSKETKKRNVTKLKPGRGKNKDPYIDSKSVSEFEACGDTKYLTEFRKALEDIRKILGADAPLQITQVPNEVDLSRFSDEQLQAYIQLVEILNAPKPTSPAK